MNKTLERKKSRFDQLFVNELIFIRVGLCTTWHNNLFYINFFVYSSEILYGILSLQVYYRLFYIISTFIGLDCERRFHRCTLIFFAILDWFIENESRLLIE